MKTAGPIALSPEKRRDTRVIFTRSVKLFVKGKLQGRYPARNLSLGGLFIEGTVNIPDGEDCHLELHETGRHSSLILTFSGKVIRQDKDGVGVKFTSMGEDSFMFLQTMVLYSSDEPVGVAEQFLETFNSDKASSG
ncbi:MAG: PilZ domain-containing protein [Desulfobulbaceae bacterium]|nr:PilZ domain-containing protein [Desulfobulbaceae bacterium]